MFGIIDFNSYICSIISNLVYYPFMKHQLRQLLLLLSLLPLFAQAVIPDIRFRRLDTRDGLSNSQVNCILRDSRGFMWLPTPFGLCRYDGYRFRTFYSFEQDTTTLRSNRVEKVMEAFSFSCR